MTPYEYSEGQIYTLWPGTPKVVPNSYKPLEIPGRVRNEIPHLLGVIGAKEGVEVGVERAAFSRVLMQGCEKLHLVDAWMHYPGYRDHVSQDKLEGFYDQVLEFERRHPGRINTIRGYSVDVAQRFGDNTLDFVYIDANHTLPQVIADLAAWTPKVRPGGLIMGHDYRKPKNNIGHHVVEAVNAWTYAYRICPWFLLGAQGDANRDQNRSYLWVNQ